MSEETPIPELDLAPPPEAVESFEEEADPNAPDPGTEEALPAWAELPPGLKIPPGRDVVFMRFKAKWTLTPEKGDRVIIMWPITNQEEKIAVKRTGGDTNELMDELTKMAVRCIDGMPVTPTTSSAVTGRLWRDLSVKCIQQMRNWYNKAHTFNQEQKLDFYGSCVAFMSSVAE